MHSHLSLELDGEATLGERTDQLDHGGYNTLALLDHVVIEDAELEVSVDDNETAGNVQLELSKYHIAASSEDDARVFHLHLAVELGWEDVARLHRYLGFLLADKDAAR